MNPSFLFVTSDAINLNIKHMWFLFGRDTTLENRLFPSYLSESIFATEVSCLRKKETAATSGPELLVCLLFSLKPIGKTQQSDKGQKGDHLSNIWGRVWLFVCFCNHNWPQECPLLQTDWFLACLCPWKFGPKHLISVRNGSFCRSFVIQDLEKMNCIYFKRGGNNGEGVAEVGWSPVQKSGLSKYSRKKSMLQISSLNSFLIVSIWSKESVWR